MKTFTVPPRAFTDWLVPMRGGGSAGAGAGADTDVGLMILKEMYTKLEETVGGGAYDYKLRYQQLELTWKIPTNMPCGDVTQDIKNFMGVLTLLNVLSWVILEKNLSNDPSAKIQRLIDGVYSQYRKKTCS